MNGTIADALVVILTSLLIAMVAVGLIVFRPWKRRHRHRKRHSHRSKIDLLKAEQAEPASIQDA